jgi:hypothetical protein
MERVLTTFARIGKQLTVLVLTTNTPGLRTATEKNSHIEKRDGTTSNMFGREEFAFRNKSIVSTAKPSTTVREEKGQRTGCCRGSSNFPKCRGQDD